MEKEFKELILSNADLIEIDESVAKKNGVEPLSKELLESLCDWKKINPMKIQVASEVHSYPVDAICVNPILNGRTFEVLCIVETYSMTYQTIGYYNVVNGMLEIHNRLTSTEHYKEIWIRMILPPTQRYWNTQL